MKKSMSGFTIVELLIVIVVIAILAAITITIFQGVSARARDSKRKSDVALIAKKLKLYSIDNSNMFETGSGCASSGNGNGFFNFENGGTYPLSMNTCMKNAGILSTDIVDPSGLTTCAGLTCEAYMKYTCTEGSERATYVYAHLETVAQTATDTDSTCAPAIDTGQGINYFVRTSY